MPAAIRNIGVGLLLVVAVLIAKWPSFIASGIRHDLHDYAKAIRGCDQGLSDKERLLDVIDAVEAQLDRGQCRQCLAGRLTTMPSVPCWTVASRLTKYG